MPILPWDILPQREEKPSTIGDLDPGMSLTHLSCLLVKLQSFLSYSTFWQGLPRGIMTAWVILNNHCIIFLFLHFLPMIKCRLFLNIMLLKDLEKKKKKNYRNNNNHHQQLFFLLASRLSSSGSHSFTQHVILSHASHFESGYVPSAHPRSVVTVAPLCCLQW